ncbi:thiol:disulfide interchange protein DsbA/DsbL [Luteimonas sp. S4-F44]|uniref:thiol:disulfide interchange protein DsbA/DsbL n=1 Tax=Luteimonas sp. S4-F44 TaxID=2925842 RepID=UPI001F53B2B8|nr:thiol:disulfide interchange protein DsbA/DsbL [Luteimonas sp. S4-F44]UNK42630.1 thiol:disulfide interchange protein DsbA/DsbL [Luteimonas sp. S4-F44]
MKIRHSLLVLLAPVLIAACGQQPDPAAAPDAAPTAPASAPASEQAPTPDAAQAPAAEAGNEAEAAAPAAHNPVVAPEGPAPVAGTDYVVIDNGQPFAQTAGKIEVAEVFAYWCGHCAAFEPLVNAWKAKLPDDVNFVAVPVVFDQNDQFPRAFYASEAMGTLARTHDATFNAIHIERKLRQNADADSIVAFYGSLGVDPQRFRSTMQSFAVNANLGRARQFATRSGVDSTPTLVVAGKYRIIGRKSLEDMLRIADHLIATERAAR